MINNALLPTHLLNRRIRLERLLDDVGFILNLSFNAEKLVFHSF